MIDLRQFDISESRGFLPDEDPLPHLSSAFSVWDDAAYNLPKLLMSGRVRQMLEKLPRLDPTQLEGQRELERAMQALSYLGHAYVWGEASAPAKLPACLAIPWSQVGRKLGRPPVLSYPSYALHNWRRFDAGGPIALGNIALLQNFLAGADEEWFILIHVDIEAKAAPALKAVAAASDAVSTGNARGVLANLGGLGNALDQMYGTLKRMPEWCDPYIYYNRVRPYIHGWNNNPSLPNGLVYEGVYDGQGQVFRGETGAQSSIVPACDALLGVYHRDDPLKEYLLEMRDYMPLPHRRFIEAIEAAPPLREFVRQTGSTELTQAYDTCVETLAAFRSKHLEYAATYIYHQAQKSESNPTAVGTGGTPFMKYLKKHRDETTEHVIQ